MPPKNKVKKGKEQDNDEHFAQEDAVDVDVPTNTSLAATVDELADDEWGVNEKSKKKKNEKKKGAVKKDVDGEDVDKETKALDVDAPVLKTAVQTTAEEAWDDEWSSLDVKGKGKKGKKGKTPKADEKETEETANRAPEAVKEEENEGEEPGSKILSKKEKEKLKKEREKAKKKAQAAAKKDDEGESQQTPAEPATHNTTEADVDKEGDEEDEDTAGGIKSDKKKKKKKGKKDEESIPVPTTVAGKKKGGLGALRAMMEERKRVEEEIRRKEDEERQRIEEEERRLAEEEARKVAEKLRRKEKEKAKKELAKKEGRLLTKKQKEERTAAELRKKALLSSGVVVEGLQSNTEAAPKRVVYGNKKKRPAPTFTAVNDIEVSPGSPIPVTPQSASTSTSIPPTSPTSIPEDEARDDRDEEKENGASDAEADVKSDWDESSGEDEIQVSSHSDVGKKSVSKGSAQILHKQQVLKSSTSSQKNAVPSESESDSDDSSDENSDDESDSDESDSDDGMTPVERLAAQRKAEAAARRAKTREAALAAGSKDNLRSPICCILGHVDTGKTKLLDKIRQTNVQLGEAGGITQQIGATYFPIEAIKQKTILLNKDNKQEYKIPGLLIIDTPGHEAFSNLRTRGSSLCNIAVLVIDIVHGIEPQTVESINLLRARKTPFVVALNKIDRLYGWEPTPDNDFRSSLAKQKDSVKRQFEMNLNRAVVQLAENGLNAALYYENKNVAKYVSIIPTSAHTGEGIPDMIMLLVNLTQQRMSDRLMYLSEVECTVLEVKVIEGLGTTIDVILSNGVLKEGDKIVLCGLEEPIVTQIRALLTPQPLRELRVKSQYIHHKEVKAALGVKITAPGLEKALAGSRLLLVGPDDDEEKLKDEVMEDRNTFDEFVNKSGGVYVQASTLGSLEALLTHLKYPATKKTDGDTEKEMEKVKSIPVGMYGIGPIHKKDVTRCSLMRERSKELVCILAFDVKIDSDARALAEEVGIKIFEAEIIYHLGDAFHKYSASVIEARQADAAPKAVWPCRLKTLRTFATRDPIILGVEILEGSLRLNTPLCVVKTNQETKRKEIVELGKVTSLEINHKSVDIVKKSQQGAGVAVKIEQTGDKASKMFGRHFDEKDIILSQITRESIDLMKSTFRDKVETDDWVLIKALKAPLGIP